MYDIIVLSLPLIRHHFFPEYSFNEMSKNDKSLENLKSDQAIPFKLLPIKLLLCRLVLEIYGRFLLAKFNILIIDENCLENGMINHLPSVIPL